MNITRLIPVFLLPVIAGIFVSCEKPVKTASNEPPKQADPVAKAETAPAIKEPAVETPAAPKPGDPPPTPVTEPALPNKPTLEVKEADNTITVSGTLSSRFQAADIVNGIAAAFPEVKVIDELKVNPEIDEVRWANRVNELLMPFLFHVDDARFFYEDGVTYLEGNVKESKLILQVQELTISVMNDTDARDIKNRLKAPKGADKKGKPAAPAQP